MDINITNPVTASKIGEVVNGANAATPNDTDLVPIVESSVTKKLTLTNLKAFLKTYFDTLYAALTASSFGTFINGLTSKTTPVDADELVISDSAAANVAKKVTGTNFKAYLKTYFDSIYQAAGSYLTSANITQVITNGVTDKAPSEDAVFDALALKQNIVSGVDDTEIGYLNGVTSSIQTQLNLKSPYVLWEYYSDGSQVSPADGSIYYSAYLNNAVATTSNTVRFLSTKTNTIFQISMNIMCPNTLGSSETSTIKLLNITAGTEETIGTITHDKRLNILGGITTLANAINDELVIQVNNPTWATNPTNVWYNWTVKAY